MCEISREREDGDFFEQRDGGTEPQLSAEEPSLFSAWKKCLYHYSLNEVHQSS